MENQQEQRQEVEKILNDAKKEIIDKVKKEGLNDPGIAIIVYGKDKKEIIYNIVADLHISVTDGILKLLKSNFDVKVKEVVSPAMGKALSSPEILEKIKADPFKAIADTTLKVINEQLSNSRISI